MATGGAGMSGRADGGHVAVPCRIAMVHTGWGACRVIAANTFFKRLRGFIGRRPERCAGDVIWFSKCSSVHTFFMGHALDIVFADKEGRVLLSLEGVPPCRIVWCRGASFVLERFSRGW